MSEATKHQEEKEGEEVKLHRTGTMLQTAAEGIAYLKDNNEDALLKAQGLDKLAGTDSKPETAKNGAAKAEPTLEKTQTMAATAKEGEILMEWMGGAPNPDAKTRGQEKALEEVNNEGPPSAKKPKVTRDSTMQATAKEAAELVSDKDRAETRAETAAKEKAAEEDTPAIKKTHTMAESLDEAKEILEGDFGESRSATAAIKKAEEEVPAAKRSSTMKQTAKEGEDFVKGKKSWD